jgi:hypothetical protein
MTHVMLDLETMSTRYNAAVASIGACIFEPAALESYTDFTPDRLFYVKLDLSKQRGRDFDGDTIYWWMAQEQEARDTLRMHIVHPHEALRQFAEWYRTKEGGVTWSLGANFDHVILQDLYNWIGMKNPINYRDQLCMRTVVKMTAEQPPAIPEIVGHRAIDDAILQAIWLQRALAATKGMWNVYQKQGTVL